MLARLACLWEWGGPVWGWHGREGLSVSGHASLPSLPRPGTKGTREAGAGSQCTAEHLWTVALWVSGPRGSPILRTLPEGICENTSGEIAVF